MKLDPHNLPPHIQRLNERNVELHGKHVVAARIQQDEPKRGVDRERDLHDDIIEHCNKQWPRWKFRHARMDKPSTEAEGVEDFTVFVPGNITVHVECKKKGGKPDDNQRDWIFEMGKLGHVVHVIYSMEEFHAAVAAEIARKIPVADSRP